MKIEIPTNLKIPEINFVLVNPKSKIAFQKGWQKKELKFDSKELIDHINNGGNYGVIGGGKKNLIIVDFDNIKLQNKIINKLPQTFTVKTGSGLLHMYFFSDNKKSFKIFDKDLNTLADIQGEGKYVIGAGSTHPNGNKYEIIDNSNIKFLHYSEILALLERYDEKRKKKEIKKPEYKNEPNNIIDKIKNSISMEDLLSEFGVDTSKNPSNCPLHSSKGGKCLGWDHDTAHCFHCDGSWNIFSFVKEMKKLNSKEAIDFLAKKAGLEEELKEERKNWAKKKKLGEIFTRKGQAKQFKKTQPYFYDKSGLFWIWNENKLCWEINDDIDVLNFIEEKGGAIDIISSRSRTEILNSLKQEGRKNIPKKMEKTWIQFKDKIYDIKSGKNFEASPEYFITNPIPYKVSGDPRTPIMDKIFEEWVGKKYVKTLYEIISYCLLPDYPINRLFCFIGGGLNGKSKFLELLRKFVGENNVCSTELDTLINSRFEVTRLHKKLVCQMGETNFNEFSKTSILKKLTGGDLIGFEYKNKTPFEDINYAKILIATNNLPTTTDKTIGFYRRWMIIDFPNKFSEKKDILGEIPEQEYNNLATKSIILLNELLNKREFNEEGSPEERMEKYESKSDFLGKFLDLFTKEDLEGYITKSDFFKKFKDWSVENRHRIMSEKSIGLAMNKIGIEHGRKHFDWMNDGKGGQARVWFGISWKN
ncbi:MAG: phage/plasmid primase, P4 family [Promethearchaeia archaeon]